MIDFQVETLIRYALAEDIGSGDVTTHAIIPEEARGSARIFAKEPLVVAGTQVAQRVFLLVDPSLKVGILLQDGNHARSGDVLVEVSGSVSAMLVAERTALNFLQRLSGIATLTRAFVERVVGTSARIVDTRKTTPGWRVLEKAAVRAGGGCNHRFGLYDGVLIKDNHIAAVGGVGPAVAAIRQQIPHTLKIEVEVETLDQLDEAMAVGVDAALLDNMAPAAMVEAVRRAGGRLALEASGGINLNNVREVAETGVDLISVGALTHSARAVDISMEIEPVKR
ncbi:MAG TPA: carboxylating nicotinate-nucleotide diphosphorylase [Syntrophobacteria bacterium]|nr:carboxylating nicotinate-nucleotide diphosphorylase [Syntrophobacteria bacterium]